MPPLHGDHPDGLFHGGIGDRDDPLCQSQRVHADLSREGRHHRPNPLWVESHLPPQESVRVESPQDEVGVSDRDLPSSTIADRSGIGPGALRAHAQGSPFIGPHQRSTARSHGVDVEERNPERQPPDLGLGGHPEIAVDEGNISGGPPHVKGDHLVTSRLARNGGSSHHAAGGTREDRPDCLLAGDGRGDAPAVRLHDPQPSFPDRLLEPAEVALHQGRDVGVHHGGDAPLVLPVLRKDPVRGGDRNPERQGPLQDLGLVTRVRIAVEQTDGDRLDPNRGQVA